MSHLLCYCGSQMILKSGKYGKYYQCYGFPKCDGVIGAHNRTGEPLGIPADQETRNLRIKAHAKFDILWKSGEMTRKQAYQWMRDQAGLGKKWAHIAMMEKDRLNELIHMIENREVHELNEGANL